MIDHLFTTFDCSHCKQTYEDFTALKVHKCPVLKGQNLELFCHICDESKVYSRIETLKNHLIDFHLRIKHPCDICDKHFTTKYMLIQHKRIHENTREKDTCKVCNKKVYRLHSHMQMHLESRETFCDICQKAFLWIFQVHTYLTGVLD